MHTIYRAFHLWTYLSFVSHIIQAFRILCQVLLIATTECCILLGQVLCKVAIMTSVWIHNALYHDDRYFRAQGTKYVDKIVSGCITTVFGTVWHRVYHIADGIFDACQCFCNIEIHTCITRSREIDTLKVIFTLDHRTWHHTYATSTTALLDTCTINHYLAHLARVFYLRF